MNSYDNIKQIWDNQQKTEMVDVPVSLKKKIAKADRVVNNSHISTIIVLSATIVFVSVGYWLLFKKHNLISILGIGTMDLALLIRIAFEWQSYKRLKQLDWLNTSSGFSAQITNYYQWRIKIHKYPTWLTAFSYVIGVALLFVEFHKYLPVFWFRFFVVEFIVILVVLFYFIRKWIRKELNSLNELIGNYHELR